jgi:hypothetical protein
MRRKKDEQLRDRERERERAGARERERKRDRDVGQTCLLELFVQACYVCGLFRLKGRDAEKPGRGGSEDISDAR